MNLMGITIGAITFVCIGVFHPIVIKAEYHFGVKCWWVFLLVGVGCVMGSLWIGDVLASTTMGVVGVSSLWSIHELFRQRKRVEKGWFPKNPKKSSAKQHEGRDGGVEVRER